MKITIDVDVENNEGTDAPWWAIIDPKQNFSTGDRGIYNISSMITGPFFSRDKATKHMNASRHAFSDKAKVFCFSGYASTEYKNAIKGQT